MPVKYVCRCSKCGKTRESYNDPRSRKSVIECKASCFESHYEWEFVSELSEDSNTTTGADVAPLYTRNDPKSSGSQGTSSAPQAEAAAAPPVRQAFVEPEVPDKTKRKQTTEAKPNKPENGEVKRAGDKTSSFTCVML